MKLAKIIDFIKSHIKINIYRVGDIILTTNNTNPKYDYGGTWELWGAGRVPVGIDLSQTEFNEVEKTGGEKTHTLTINEMPSHNHQADYSQSGGVNIGVTAMGSKMGTSTLLKSTGGGQAHNNLQPYITMNYIIKY